MQRKYIRYFLLLKIKFYRYQPGSPTVLLINVSEEPKPDFQKIQERKNKRVSCIMTYVVYAGFFFQSTFLAVA